MIWRSLVGAVLALSAVPARAEWLEARTNSFVVLADAPETEVRDLATRLEHFDQGMRRLRDIPAVTSRRSNPLTVYILPGVDDVQRICRVGHPSGCANVRGFYLGRVEGSVAYTPRRAESRSPLALSPQTVLFHEYVHHFMAENYPAAYPAWFSEGFAEFNSSVVFEKDGSLGFGRAALHRYYGLLTGKPLSLEAMLADDRPPRGADQMEALYGRGWLLTHYLSFNAQRKGQLNAYLLAINQGARGRTAAEKAFGDIAKLDRELDAYAKLTKLNYMSLAAKALTPVSITLRRLGPGEAAMMPVRLRSDRGVDRRTAETIVLDARRIAARYPADPAVQAVLAEAEFDAGDDDAADAAAERALASDPNARGAMLYKGRVQTRRLETAGSRDEKAWRAARSWYVRANALDNDDATALALFYMTFIAAGRTPTPNAVTALERASVLVPQDGDLRWRLVRQYITDGRLKDARAELAPLAFNPHASPENPFARLLTILDGGDLAAARTAMNTLENEASEPDSMRWSEKQTQDD